MSTRDELESRWQEVAAELERITSTRPIPDQAFSEEQQEVRLLAEQDAIAWRLGRFDRQGSSFGPQQNYGRE